MKTIMSLATLPILVIALTVPAAARESHGGQSVETRADTPQLATVIKATGVLQRRGIATYQYGTHRMIDTSSKRLYALKSSRYPALLDRYVEKRVAVYGTRVPGFPGDFGPPLLDVFRVVPLQTPSSPEDARAASVSSRKTDSKTERR